MKEKIHYFIEAALAVAVIILFVFQFSGNKTQSNVNEGASEGETAPKEILPVAYVDIDSLMANYTYSIDLSEQLAKKYENMNANLVEKYRKFETEANDFKRKIETGAFLSQERAKQEEERLVKQQESLRAYEAQSNQDFQNESARVSAELRNTIIVQINEYNKSKGYNIIFGKRNDNILYADNTYNITADVINFLNKRHPAEKTTE